MTLKDLSGSGSGSGAHGHVTFSQGGSYCTYKSPGGISLDIRRIARTERAPFRSYPNSDHARRGSETPRGRRPRELTRKQLMEKLVETQYIPSLKTLIPTNKPARVKPQRPDGGAGPTRLGPMKPNRRVYISPEELERGGIRIISRAPVTKPNSETKGDQRLATKKTSLPPVSNHVPPHLRLHTVASTQQTIRSSSGSPWAAGPGVSVLTAATAAVVLPNPANTSQIATDQTIKKLVSLKASPQDVRSRDRAMPTTPVDETPTPRPTAHASVVAQPTLTPLTHLRSTRDKENKVPQTSRPSASTAPQTPRWLTAPRAWPKPATATSAGLTSGRHLLPLSATLAAPRPMAVPRTTTAAADLELLVSYPDPRPTVQPEQTVKPAAPAPPAPLPSLVPHPVIPSPLVISSPPPRSPNLSTAETSPLQFRNVVSLQQEDHRSLVPQPGPEADSHRSAGGPMMRTIESALGPASLNAPEELDASLLLIHYGTPPIPDFIPSTQHAMRHSSSLVDLLGLNFF